MPALAVLPSDVRTPASTFGGSILGLYTAPPTVRRGRLPTARLPPPPGELWGATGRRFGHFTGHYVFMCLAPSFLRFPAVRVTRITESKRDRLVYPFLPLVRLNPSVYCRGVVQA